MIRQIQNIFRMRRFGLMTRPKKEGQYQVTRNGEMATLCHSAFQTDWFGELGISPQTIVELGPFDGGDISRFQTLYPNCRCVAVEADPERAAIVRANTKGTEIEVVEAAACGENGPITWYPSEINGETDAQGSIYQHSDKYKSRFSFVSQREATTVDGRRLDDLCAELAISSIDLLHMDIEGAEYLALKGLGDLRPKMIFSEIRNDMFESGIRIADTERLLADMGYDLALDLRIDRLYLHNSVN